MQRIFFLGLFALVLVLPACDRGGSFRQLGPNDVVLAFGDSLTKGVGATAELSYPAQLSRLIARRVVNGGISGELSEQGARRLPGLLDEVQPDLVIICHGGNDILQQRDRAQLKENLRRMVDAAGQRDIDVVMIAVPRPGLLPADLGLYQELAGELRIPLLKGTLGDLLFDRAYKSDAVHLNATGYRKLAEALAELLQDSQII